MHSVRTKEKLVVREQLAEPRVVEKWQVEINKKTFGPKFKKNAKAVEEAILSYTDECFAQLQKDLEANGVAQVEVGSDKFEVSKDDVSVQKAKVTEHGKLLLFLYMRCMLLGHLYMHVYSP